MRLPVLLAALGGMAASETRELDDTLAGRVAGKPEACLVTSRLDSPQVIGDRVILYRDGGRIWRNDLPDACPGLDRGATLVTEVHGGQLCRGDLVHTVRLEFGGIPGPLCRLGSFTPWEGQAVISPPTVRLGTNGADDLPP